MVQKRKQQKKSLPKNLRILNPLQILKEELPPIGKKSDKIISGPEYRGIESINGEKTTILILTECKQDDYHSVSRLVNREVLKVFKEHDIKLL